MSFETDLKKLQKMWDNGQDNTNLLADAQMRQSIKKQQVKNLFPIQTVITNLNDIGGNYIDIKVLMTKPYLINGFQWTITQVLPESWIPMIRLEIGYNASGVVFNNIVTYMNKVVNVVPTFNGMVIATWNINLFLCSYNTTVIIPDFQAKLYFTLIDPNLVV
jgi:hypothetical protein